MAEYLGVDSIGYLDIDGMIRATGLPKNEFCLACFNGEYPVPIDRELDKFISERRSARSWALSDPAVHPELFAGLK